MCSGRVSKRKTDRQTDRQSEGVLALMYICVDSVSVYGCMCVDDGGVNPCICFCVSPCAYTIVAVSCFCVGNTVMCTGAMYTSAYVYFSTCMAECVSGV